MGRDINRGVRGGKGEGEGKEWRSGNCRGERGRRRRRGRGTRMGSAIDNSIWRSLS
jgi:hypothetical protein